MKSTNKERLMFRFGLNIYVALALICGLVSCGNDESSQVVSSNPDDSSENKDGLSNLQDLAWLSGVWKDTTTYSFKSYSQFVIEDWTAFPDSMSGIGKMVKNGDTTISESLCIRMVNNKLTFIARPQGKAMISFPLVSDSAGILTFENPINDFPSRITYRKITNRTMLVRWQGYNQGREMDRPMDFFKE
jgi:hypothetical protein